LSGKPDLARAVYDEAEGRSRHDFVSPFWLASMSASAGLAEEARRHVARGVTEHDPLVIWGRKSPFWDEIRSDPACQAIVRRVWADADELRAGEEVSPTV
jgi:hypothetical protein